MILRDRYATSIYFLICCIKDDEPDGNTTEYKNKIENTNMTKDEVIGCLENLRDHSISFEDSYIQAIINKLN